MFIINGEKLSAPNRDLQQRLSIHPSSGCLPGAELRRDGGPHVGQGSKVFDRMVLKTVWYSLYWHWPVHVLLSIFMRPQLTTSSI